MMDAKERSRIVQRYIKMGPRGLTKLYESVQKAMTARLRDSRGCSFSGGIRTFPDYERYRLLDPEAFWEVVGSARNKRETLGAALIRLMRLDFTWNNPPHPFILPVEGPTPKEVWEEHFRAIREKNPTFIPWRLVDAPTDENKAFRDRIIDVTREVLDFDIKPQLPDSDQS